MKILPIFRNPKRLACFCNSYCRNNFEQDRKLGLIYGQVDIKGIRMGWEEGSLQAGFCAYCGKQGKLQILSNVNIWIEVSAWVFRSWAGKRKLDGRNYHSDVYFLGTNKIVK